MLFFYTITILFSVPVVKHERFFVSLNRQIVTQELNGFSGPVAKCGRFLYLCIVIVHSLSIRRTAGPVVKCDRFFRSGHFLAI